jgi:hypothetical protein
MYLAGTNDTEVFLEGKSGKDLRRINEIYSDVLTAINTASTADVEKVIDLTIRKKEGQLEERVTPYKKSIEKSRIVEFQADPNLSDNSIVTVKKGKGAERVIYYVSNTYGAIKASFNA